MNNNSGFTLIETLIAVVILMMAFAAILGTQSNSIETSRLTKELNVVTMLAKNAMVKAELEIEGKKFDQVKEETTEEFPEPYREFSWTRKIKKIKFPDFSTPKKSDEKEGDEQAPQDPITAIIFQLFVCEFSNSIREVNVSVNWKKLDKIKTFTLSTYWVDLSKDKFEMPTAGCVQ